MNNWPFTKQANKFGYSNQPCWQLVGTPTHLPCGFWWGGPKLRYGPEDPPVIPPVSPVWVDIVDPSYWNQFTYGATWVTDHWHSGSYNYVSLFNSLDNWQEDVRFSKIKITHTATPGSGYPRLTITDKDYMDVSYTEDYMSNDEVVVDWSTGGATSNILRGLGLWNGTRGAFDVSHIYIYTSDLVVVPGPY